MQYLIQLYLLSGATGDSVNKTASVRPQHPSFQPYYPASAQSCVHLRQGIQEYGLQQLAGHRMQRGEPNQQSVGAAAALLRQRQEEIKHLKKLLKQQQQLRSCHEQQIHEQRLERERRARLLQRLQRDSEWHIGPSNVNYLREEACRSCSHGLTRAEAGDRTAECNGLRRFQLGSGDPTYAHVDRLYGSLRGHHAHPSCILSNSNLSDHDLASSACLRGQRLPGSDIFPFVSECSPRKVSQGSLAHDLKFSVPRNLGEEWKFVGGRKVQAGQCQDSCISSEFSVRCSTCRAGKEPLICSTCCIRAFKTGLDGIKQARQQQQLLLLQLQTCLQSRNRRCTTSVKDDADQVPVADSWAPKFIAATHRALPSKLPVENGSKEEDRNSSANSAAGNAQGRIQDLRRRKHVLNLVLFCGKAR